MYKSTCSYYKCCNSVKQSSYIYLPERTLDESESPKLLELLFSAWEGGGVKQATNASAIDWAAILTGFLPEIDFCEEDEVEYVELRE